MVSKVVVITHTDCDGLCSAAIALKKYPTAYIIFSQPFALKPVLSWKEVERAEIVIILDIAYSEESSCLGKLIQLDQEKTLIYIDHHISSLELVDKLQNVFVDTNLSASQLTAIYFRIPSILAEIGAICDKVLLVSKNFKLFKEAELLRKSITYDPYDDNFRLEVIHSLVVGKLPSEIEEVVKRAEISTEVMNKLIEKVEDHIIYNNKFIVVDVTKDSNFVGRVGHIAAKLSLKYNKPVFIISQSNDRYILTGRDTTQTVDLSKVMRFFGGNGKSTAASVRITKDQIKDIVKLLQKVIELE